MFTQKIALFSIIGGFLGLMATIFFGMIMNNNYDYAENLEKINIFHSGGVKILSGSLDINKSPVSIVLQISKEYINPDEDIMITWNQGKQSYSRILDREDSDQTPYYYTFPFVTNTSGVWNYTITLPTTGSYHLTLEVLTLESKLSMTYPRFSPHELFAAERAPNIISRKEWGADESIRYWPDESVKKQKEAWMLRNQQPLYIVETPSQKEARLLDEKRGVRIKEIRKDAAVITSLTRYENGKKLIWPIKKTKLVDRIILHHTAENLEQSADDTTILKAIYYYHARTRGWGDIGYNYIIGQRGQIYEGRAGGDYVEGAHAYANNLGSVGVSVMGNFEHMTLNRDQRAGLTTLLDHLVKKYGINVGEKTMGVRTCKTGGDCLFDESEVMRLHGHRDVGYTTCPGTNLYNLLDDFRESIILRIGRQNPVVNTAPGVIESVPKEDEVTYIEEKAPIKNTLGGTRLGKNIKIKLSYPKKDTIDISHFLGKNFTLQMGNRNINLFGEKSIKIHTDKNNMLSITIGSKKYKASTVSLRAEVLKIDSWERIPAWDIKKEYNDNLFRSRLLISNVRGELLVINELPLEHYLRGLGEVSNTDFDEKIKTIIVAARSYAMYYMNPKNRKYNTKLYDGSDDPDSFQRYLGYGYELRSPKVVNLVDATKGQVITYNGEVIKAWYFSSSDGKTLSYEEYCKSMNGKNCMNIPYLISVDDPGGLGRSRLGHGVGISGIGATYFAREGWDYRKIIQYFLKGVEIKKK